MTKALKKAQAVKAPRTRAVQDAAAKAGVPTKSVKAPKAKAEKAPVKTKEERALESATAVAQKVMDWAKEHYDSKQYAWHRLVETTTVEEMAKELIESGNTTYAKAIVQYRATAKLWAEQEAEVKAA